LFVCRPLGRQRRAGDSDGPRPGGDGAGGGSSWAIGIQNRLRPPRVRAAELVEEFLVSGRQAAAEWFIEYEVEEDGVEAFLEELRECLGQRPDGVGVYVGETFAGSERCVFIRVPADLESAAALIEFFEEEPGDGDNMPIEVHVSELGVDSAELDALLKEALAVTRSVGYVEALCKRGRLYLSRCHDNSHRASLWNAEDIYDGMLCAVKQDAAGETSFDFDGLECSYGERFEMDADRLRAAIERHGLKGRLDFEIGARWVDFRWV
jgi:hypothetical protein